MRVRWLKIRRDWVGGKGGWRRGGGEEVVVVGGEERGFRRLRGCSSLGGVRGEDAGDCGSEGKEEEERKRGGKGRKETRRDLGVSFSRFGLVENAN